MPLDPAIEHPATGISFQDDPDGGVRIEIKPQGLSRIIPVTGLTSILGLSSALLFGVITPIAGAVWACIYRGEAYWLFIIPMLLIFTLAALFAVPLSKAMRHVRIFANADRLTLWTNGPLDPRTLEWRRDEILNVEARWTLTWTGDGEVRSGGLMIHSRSKTESFLDFLPDDSVREIASRIRKALGKMIPA